MYMVDEDAFGTDFSNNVLYGVMELLLDKDYTCISV
jgi:hypothetical protein